MVGKKRDDKQPDYNNKQRKKEHKYGDTVYAVHIFNPLRLGLVRIPLFYVQVFCKLSQHTHKNNLRHKNTVKLKTITTQ
jgi:hypothetical protein